MNYKCLVLDHDDTAVQSTPQIHYPSFCEVMELLRPEAPPYTLHRFMRECFDPGFSALCREIQKFTEEEMQIEYEVWKRNTDEKNPEFYPGFLELVRDFKAEGGYICIVSHSESSQIARHYEAFNLKPDFIFGWEMEEAHRKPNAYPIEETIRCLGLTNRDLLVVDDLRPGFDMARRCGVDFAAAGWSHMVEEIRAFMGKHADYYCNTVEDLRRLAL